MDDWTRLWKGAAGLALSAWTRNPRLLASPAAARILELCLESAVLRGRLVLHGYVILPGALHVVSGRPARGEADPAVSWPSAIGRVKGSFARVWNERTGSSGAIWRARTRIRPLAHRDIAEAVERCHESPVRAGLARSAAEHAFSSWHSHYGTTSPGLVRSVY